MTSQLYKNRHIQLDKQILIRELHYTVISLEIWNEIEEK